jgi:hypothetical protein
MEKDFVPYEPALELKELGFDEPCFGYYIELRNPQEGILTIDKCENNINGVLAPTFSQAFRWFREKYKKSHIWLMDELLDSGEYTYEEAEIACLKKLIEIVKK